MTPNPAHPFRQPFREAEYRAMMDTFDDDDPFIGITIGCDDSVCSDEDVEEHEPECLSERKEEQWESEDDDPWEIISAELGPWDAELESLSRRNGRHRCAPSEEYPTIGKRRCGHDGERFDLITPHSSPISNSCPSRPHKVACEYKRNGIRQQEGRHHNPIFLNQQRQQGDTRSSEVIEPADKDDQAEGRHRYSKEIARSIQSNLGSQPSDIGSETAKNRVWSGIQGRPRDPTTSVLQPKPKTVKEKKEIAQATTDPGYQHLGQYLERLPDSNFGQFEYDYRPKNYSSFDPVLTRHSQRDSALALKHHESYSDFCNTFECNFNFNPNGYIGAEIANFSTKKDQSVYLHNTTHANKIRQACLYFCTWRL
jgi:hypothetical protein